jgi:DNA-binding NarL/FixJ family response regulator
LWFRSTSLVTASRSSPRAWLFLGVEAMTGRDGSAISDTYVTSAQVVSRHADHLNRIPRITDRANVTRVLVVDDVSLFRAGLTAALEATGYDVLGEAEDAESAVALAEITQPDIVLLDVLMPGISGIDALADIATVAPNAAVVLLTGSESEEDMITAVGRGARGYILKDMPFEELVVSIDGVSDGGGAVSPLMAGKLFDMTRQLLRQQDIVGTRKPKLTKREIEILHTVADGLTNPQIAVVLYISEYTVKNHIRNIFEKLDVRSRHEAVAHAVREELFTVAS